MNIYQRPSTYQYCTVGSTIMGKISLSCLLTVELYTYIYTDCISSLSLYAIQADVTFVLGGYHYTLYNIHYTTTMHCRATTMHSTASTVHYRATAIHATALTMYSTTEQQQCNPQQEQSITEQQQLFHCDSNP